MKRKYTEEFKKDAIELASKIGVTEASKNLNIASSQIYAWRKALRVEGGQNAIKGVFPGETAEQAIKRLEKEANELREANEVLKKALGFMVVR
jgi:transposase